MLTKAKHIKAVNEAIHNVHESYTHYGKDLELEIHRLKDENKLLKEEKELLEAENIMFTSVESKERLEYE